MASESHLQNIGRGAFAPYFIILHLELEVKNRHKLKSVLFPWFIHHQKLLLI